MKRLGEGERLGEWERFERRGGSDRLDVHGAQSGRDGDPLVEPGRQHAGGCQRSLEIDPLSIISS